MLPFGSHQAPLYRGSEDERARLRVMGPAQGDGPASGGLRAVMPHPLSRSLSLPPSLARACALSLSLSRSFSIALSRSRSRSLSLWRQVESQR